MSYLSITYFRQFSESMQEFRTTPAHSRGSALRLAMISFLILLLFSSMMLPQSLDIVKRLSEDQQRTVYATASNLKLMIIKQLKLMKQEDQERQPKDLRLALGDDFPAATDAKK